jgi:hypothetical protein
MNKWFFIFADNHLNVNMKKSLLLIASIVIYTNSFAQTQIGNGSMEAWENVGSSTEEPTNWNSFKNGTGTMASLFGSTTIARSTSVRPGTGTYCARIWSKSTLGIIANGNMTLGRIQMGSATATDPANYNYSITANALYSEALTDAPDSLVFWVKYTNANAASNARVSAVLHDTYDYRDGYNVDAASAPHKVAEISHNYPSTGGQWIRKSLPWNYTGPATTHTYVLITFTTNSIPGGGNANDEVLIDDVELIYNPVNQAPVANDDAITTLEDAAVVIPVVSNDTDPENDLDATSVTIVANPSNGTVSVDPVTGEITYTPNLGWFGTDVFTYSICDNGTPVICDQATVTVTVTEVVAGNNAIIANDDIAVTDMNVAVVTNVLANDVDFENNINNSSLVVTVQPTNGTTSVNTTTGEITYTPDAGYFGVDTYTYSICDATPTITCDEAVVSVTVNLNWGINESQLNSFQVSLNDQVISISSTEELSGSYNIYSMSGAMVQSGAIQSTVQFNNPKGIYFIHLTTVKGTFTQKIVNL